MWGGLIQILTYLLHFFPQGSEPPPPRREELPTEQVGRRPYPAGGVTSKILGADFYPLNLERIAVACDSDFPFSVWLWIIAR